MKPITTEKAIMKLERENTISFVTDLSATREDIKKEVEEILDVKVERVRTLIRDNKKYAYVKLKKDFPAIDLATKLGMM